MVPSVDCQRGTLLGLAITDALGAAIVLQPPGMFTSVTGYRADADTTGAVCGQFAGAYWGESGIPQEWRNGLARPEMIEKGLQRLMGYTK